MKTLARITTLALVLGVLTFSPSERTVVVPELVDATMGVVVPGQSATPTTLRNVRDGDGELRGARRSAPTAAPLRFSMIGFELPDGVESLRVRTAGEDRQWGAWTELERMGTEDGPDEGTREAAGDRSGSFTDPLWVGDAVWFQLELTEGAVTSDLEIDATFIDALGLSGEGGSTRVRVPGSVAEASSRPNVVSRAQWGANESWRRGSPSVAGSVDMTVVHHTGHAAGSVANSYSRADAPALVRSFYSYHTRTLGWNDIGYNMLIDRFGTVYEGRAGGLDRGVVGAHAAGYNSGSFGVSVIGNFVDADASSAAYESLADVIGWKSSLHGMDPLGTTGRSHNGQRLRTISGHRDMGQTACPGRINDRLWWVRTKASERRGPTTSAPVQARFADVPANSVHRANILRLDDRGTMTGYSPARFGPADTLTRAQMATIVARALDLAPVAPDGRFSDVDAATGHAGHIHAVARAGIVDGYPGGRFRPDAPVRRDQMASFLGRGLTLPPSQPRFRDVSLGNPHRQHIGALQAAGIAEGSGGHYRPGSHLRRDQAATLIARALEHR